MIVVESIRANSNMMKNEFEETVLSNENDNNNNNENRIESENGVINSVKYSSNNNYNYNYNYNYNNESRAKFLFDDYCSRSISKYISSFTDTRDEGAVIISHFSLLLGIAAPCWLLPLLPPQPPPPFTIVHHFSIMNNNNN